MKVIDRKKESINKQKSLLSKQEVKVLEELIKGSRNREIAKVLGIHEKTVSTYKARLINKFKLPIKFK